MSKLTGQEQLNNVETADEKDFVSNALPFYFRTQIRFFPNRVVLRTQIKDFPNRKFK